MYNTRRSATHYRDRRFPLSAFLYLAVFSVLGIAAVAAIMFTTSGGEPTASVESPANGATIGGDLLMSGSAAGGGAADNVELSLQNVASNEYWNGTTWQQEPTRFLVAVRRTNNGKYRWSFQISANRLRNGQHSAKVFRRHGGENGHVMSFLVARNRVITTTTAQPTLEQNQALVVRSGEEATPTAESPATVPTTALPTTVLPTTVTSPEAELKAGEETATPPSETTEQQRAAQATKSPLAKEDVESAPTTAKPTTAKPTTAKPTATSPITSQPVTTVTSASAEPATSAKKTVAKPTTPKQPTTTARQTTTAKPTTTAARQTTTVKATTKPPTTAAPSGGRVVWEENFNSFNSSVWKKEHSTYGDGNNELQCYKPDNVWVANGKLVLRAVHETYTCPNGPTRRVTSGMVRSQGVTFQPGQALEFRVKLNPADADNQGGLWPAVWASGFGDGGWPRAGEIDFLEVMTAVNPKRTLKTLHYMKPDGNHGKTSNGGVFLDEYFSASWHTFRFDYGSDGVLVWYQDGKEVHRVTDVDTIQGYPDPFNNPIKELKINLALGGSPGPLDYAALGSKGATYEIDYVRILTLG